MLLVQENNVLIPVNPNSTKRRESFSNPASRLSEKVFQILGETFILAPKILTALFPVIQTHFLVHDDDRIREKSTELLATCFEAEPPGYNLILDAPDLWKAYLSRLNDKLASVRLIVVRSLGPILSKTTTVSTVIRQVLDGLNPRTQDLDENVRLACVCAIHETIQNRPRIFTVNLSNKTTFTGIHPFVQIITKQMLDKKTRLRTYSMYIAGAVYEALFRTKNNNPECENWAIYLSERLLRNYRRPTVTSDDKACIERVLRKYLIGDYKITEHERLDRFLMLYQNSSPPVRQIIMFLINAHGDYQKRFKQLFSMLEGDENDLKIDNSKINNSEEMISSDKENVDTSSNSNVSNSTGKLNNMSDGFHNLSIQAQDKIVAKLINELGRRTPPTALISNELRYGTNHCDFLTILSVAQQSKDQKIEESLITVWRKLADGSIEDTDRRRIVLDLVNPNMEIDKSQRSVEKIQKLLDYDPNKSGSLSKSRLGTSGNNAISRPTLRQFDACLEHTRPWLVDVKFMQLLIRKYREELEENNAEFDGQTTDGSQKTENGDSEKTQNSDVNSPQNTQDSIDTSMHLEEKLPAKKALTEILQQIFKSYSIQKIDNYSKQFISPIVQIFSEQTIYTEPFINLMRVIINSSPFKNPGMAGSRALLSCSLQNLVDECNSHNNITPTIIKQVCECWYSLASDADEIVETFYKIVDHEGKWSLSELAILGVFSKSLPNECERKACKIWEKLKPVLKLETEVEPEKSEPEKALENTENSDNTEPSDSTPRRSGRARKSVATPISKPTPKRVRKPKIIPVDTEYVRHAIKCCVRCVQSLQAPTEMVAEFYDELINLTQCEYKDVKIAAGTAILKMHALPRILTKEIDSVDGVARRVHLIPLHTSLKAVQILIGDEELEVRRSIYKKLYVLFSNASLPSMFIALFAFSSMDPSKQIRAEVQQNLSASILRLKQEQNRASEKVKASGRFNVEVAIVTLVYLISVRPIYTESEASDPECLNDAKTCFDLLLNVLLSRDDHVFGRIATAMELIKLCGYTENNENENKTVVRHLKTVCEVASFCIQKISAKKHVNIPHIPKNVAGRIIPQKLFKRLKVDLDENKTSLLTDDFYKKYR